MPSSGGAGSSPRVRGTLAAGEEGVGRERFIPACAGNSPGGERKGGGEGRFIPACAGNSIWSWPAKCAAGVHPRVCGELDDLEKRGDALRRFIPACAGNSETPASRLAATTVHPRVCGELHERERILPPNGRFIPACAGNSLDERPANAPMAVHPRVCGELTSPKRQGRPAAGSSPRVRGTRDRRPADRRRRRFIPACAGNSRRPAALRPRPSVHPRVCGELAGHAANMIDAERFIPACAGNSPRRYRTLGRRPVHPRVCGELAAVQRGCTAVFGSSPRVRGTLDSQLRISILKRFIPACAGNSA